MVTRNFSAVSSDQLYQLLLTYSPITHSVEVIRPQDLLVLRFDFINFVLQTSTDAEAMLVRIQPTKPAYMLVHFPAQNIAEQAFFETVDDYPVPDDDDDAGKGPDPLSHPPVQTRLAGPSRLAFLIPDDITTIPYRLADLLDWSRFSPSVHPTALPPPTTKPSLSVVDHIAVLDKNLIALFNEYDAENSFQDVSEVPPVSDILPEIEGVASLEVNQGQLEAGIFDESILGHIPDWLGIYLPKISEPALHQTAIEYPYRLILSPHSQSAWAHTRETDLSALAKNGRYELWHTRLAVKSSNNDQPIDETNSFLRTLRAIWTPEYPYYLAEKSPGDTGAFPYRMSLDSRDRYELVRLMADFYGEYKDGQTYLPLPVKVGRFMLTSLGAWVNLHGSWDPPRVTVDYPPPYSRILSSALGISTEQLSVEEWRHRGTMGRDNYVRVVYKGYLWPFGHRASLVKITERKFETHTVSFGSFFFRWQTAYLRQRMYIIVRQPDLEYPRDGQAHHGRQFPFRRLHLTTQTTPNLDQPVNWLGDNDPENATEIFWPHVAGQDFLFPVVAEDQEGQVVEWTTPLLFIKASLADDTTRLDTVASQYAADNTRNTRQLNGQSVAFAPFKKRGDTNLACETITFGGEVPKVMVTTRDQPSFFPTVTGAEVAVPAMRQLLNSSAVFITWHKNYIDSDLSGGEVFAIVSASAVTYPLPADLDNPKFTFPPANLDKPDLAFPADKAGGVVTPDIQISGLSRSLGPVGGDLAKLDQSKFHPSSFFGGLTSAKILGGIRLIEILNEADLESAPKLTNRFDAAANGRVTELSWQTNNLKSDMLQVFQPKGSQLKITAVITPPPGGANDPQFDINGNLTSFAINLFDIIIVEFNHFAFHAKSGQKLTVDPSISKVSFGGPLEFVNALQDYLSFGNGTAPEALPGGVSLEPFLDVTAAAVTAGFTLAIPNIEVGAFTLKNVSFYAAMHLPFLGDPMRLRFKFSEREKPFLVGVMMFAGGGYFGLALGLDGMELLEAAIEFGGNLSLDIGVASGGVYVMAGIYYKWEVKDNKETAELTGYLKMGGSLDVLGIISASVEFNMGLTYNFGTGKVIGKATVTVEIDVLLFSGSVDLPVERRFAGSAADPTFQDVMPEQSLWDSYCDAFAAYPTS